MESPGDSVTISSPGGGVAYLGSGSDATCHTDVVIVARDGRLAAHRAVLSAGCALLEMCLKSVSNLEDDAMLHFPEFGVEEIRTLLDVLYGKVSLVPFGQVRAVAEATKFKWANTDGIVRIKLNKIEKEAKPSIDVNDYLEVKNDYYEGNSDVTKVVRRQRAPTRRPRDGHGRAMPRCPMCNTDLRGEQELQDHLLQHGPALKRGEDGWLVCPEFGCRYSNPSSEGMETHVKLTHDKRFCIYCQEFLPLGVISQHLQAKHKHYPHFQCLFCPRLLRSSNLLKEHTANLHGDDFVNMEEDPNEPGTLICLDKSCDFIAHDRFEMVNHISGSHGVFMCPFCAIKKPGLEVLQKHSSRKHPNRKLFTCRACEFVFRDKDEFREHRKHDHEKSPRKRDSPKKFGKKRQKVVSDEDEEDPDFDPVKVKRELNSSPTLSLEDDFIDDANAELWEPGYIKNEDDLKVKSVPKVKRKKDDYGHEVPMCPICYTEFESEDYLLEHLPVHRPVFKTNENNWLMCPEAECEYIYPDNDGMETHVKIVHNKRYCLYCNDFMPSPGFGEHLRVLHPKDPHFQCLFCVRLFRTSAFLREHTRDEHNEDFVRFVEDPNESGLMVCPEHCGYTNHDRFDVVNHLIECHNVFLCPFCAIRKVGIEALQKHSSRNHCNRKLYSCNSCLVILRDKEEFANHRSVAHAEEDLEKDNEMVLCEICGQEKRKSRIYDHRKSCKGNVKKSAMPELPPKHPKLIGLRKSEANDWQCPNEGCDFRHPTKCKLELHFNHVHNRQTCTYCGKEYSYYNIGEHVAFAHTGQTKRVQCPECPEMFYNFTHLRRHKEAVHMPDATWICSVCGDKFPTSRAEIVHRAEKHTRKRNWLCPVCGKVFRSSTLVQSHVQSDHPGLEVPKDMIKKAE